MADDLRKKFEATLLQNGLFGWWVRPAIDALLPLIAAEREAAYRQGYKDRAAERDYDPSRHPDEYKDRGPCGTCIETVGYDPEIPCPHNDGDKEQDR